MLKDCFVVLRTPSNNTNLTTNEGRIDWHSQLFAIGPFDIYFILIIITSSNSERSTAGSTRHSTVWLFTDACTSVIWPTNIPSGKAVLSLEVTTVSPTFTSAFSVKYCKCRTPWSVPVKRPFSLDRAEHPPSQRLPLLLALSPSNGCQYYALNP